MEIFGMKLDTSKRIKEIKFYDQFEVENRPSPIKINVVVDKSNCLRFYITDIEDKRDKETIFKEVI